MRKSPFFSAVLTLFLLVPASITWAQTVTLTGIVYENNNVKIPFKVPGGAITVYLPDDMMAGNQISGTVSLAPDGKNERAKKANLSELEKYIVFLRDGTPVRYEATVLRDKNVIAPATQYTFSEKIRDTKGNSVTFDLKDAKGNTVSKAEIPLILFSQTISGQGHGEPVPTESISFTYEKIKTGYEIQKKIITSSENLVLQNNKVWVLDELAQLPDFSYVINDISVRPLCSSPRKTVIGIPPGTIGTTTIIVKDKNGNTVFEDEVYIVEIKATIDKTNLRKNERTTMHVTADGANECPYPLSMVIVNNSSETVLLDKGIHQTYHYDPAFESMREGIVSSLDVHQGVTGVVPGAYNITANLILPTTAFGDVFHQQKSALKSPEDYNAWADAVKKDLKAYADKQGNDEVGKAAKANAQRTIDNIPKCFDKNKLEECKAFADAYLRPVNIPKGAANMWVCGFEAYKAAIKAITGTLGGKAELIDWEVIKNGLEFIRNMGEQLKDEGLQNGASDAKKMAEDIQKEGETKEKLQELNDALQELNNKIKKEISINPSSLFAYEMEDLLVESVICSIPGYRTINGTNAGVLINGQDAGGVLSINKSVNGAYEMQIIPGTSTELSSWINSFLNNNPAPSKVNIIVPPKANAVDRTLDFKNAFIQEIEFPKIDAGDKGVLEMKITIQPERIEYSSGGGKAKTTGANQEKKWMPANFNFKIDGIENKYITKIDLPATNVKITKEQIGQAKDYRITPGKLEYPNITFYVPEMDIKPWMDWYEDFRNQNKAVLKNGSVQYFDNNSRQLMAFTFKDITPVNVLRNQSGNYTVSIRPGETLLGYKVNNPPLFNVNAGHYVANEIAGNPCNPEGAKTSTWLYIEKPCRVEMKTTRAENVSPDSEEALDEIADFLGEVSEKGAKMGERLSKAFSVTNSFAIWIEVVRDWESYKAEYVCRNGVWQHGEMYLVNSGTKQVTYWERLTDESGQSAWTKDDDMGWIWRKANELKNKACK